MKKRKSVILLILLFGFTTAVVFAYDNLKTHPDLTDATIDTAEKAINTIIDPTQKAAGQNKVLGQKIISAAVRPAQAAVKAPVAKSPSSPSGIVVTISPVKSEPKILPPVYVLPPGTTTPSETASGTPENDFPFHIYGLSESVSTVVTGTATITIAVITPQSSSTPTSTDAISTASSTASSTDPAPEPTATSSASSTESHPHVVISELYANEFKDGSEWVELYNPTDATIDLSGWKLETESVPDGDAALSPGSEIRAHGYYLIGDLENYLWRGKPEWPRPDHLKEEITLADHDGWARLRDAGGEVVDTVGWGDASVFETAAISETGYGKGKSFKRRAMDDTDNNNEDFSVNDTPDPERYNLTCTEIPSEDSFITEGQLTIDQSPYCVYDWLQTNPGDSVIIEPGVIIKFAPDKGLNIDGELIAEGTVEQKVYFTSIYDPIGGRVEGWNKDSLIAGEWAGVEFYPVAKGRFDWTVFRYAGAYGNEPDGSQSLFAGIYSMGADLLIDHSVFYKNKIGVNITDGGSAKISNSQFIANDAGVINRDYWPLDDPNIIIEAAGNYWGSPSGPHHATLNPDGGGDSVTDRVQFTPWLTDSPFIF